MLTRLMESEVGGLGAGAAGEPPITGYVTLTTTSVLVAPAGVNEKKTRTLVMPVLGSVIDWDNAA